MANVCRNDMFFYPCLPASHFSLDISRMMSRPYAHFSGRWPRCISTCASSGLPCLQSYIQAKNRLAFLPFALSMILSEIPHLSIAASPEYAPIQYVPILTTDILNPHL